MPDDLAKAIAASIEGFNAVTPVTIVEILTALEQVRHTLTEAFLRASGGRVGKPERAVPGKSRRMQRKS